MAQARVLVTGISGLLGSNVARLAHAAGLKVTGTYQQHPVSIGETSTIPLDLETANGVGRVVEEVGPELVIHTAAMSRPDDCANDPERCQAVNVDSSRLLARAAKAAGAKFVFLSSDLVYGPQPGLLDEDTSARPVGVYAESKLRAEQAVIEETDGDAFVARTSLIYGWGSGATAGTFEEWLAILRAGKRIRAFTDQRRCPTYVDDLGNALLAAREHGLRGVYNVAGPEYCSRFDFAVAMASEFGLDEQLIEPFSIDNFNYSDPRPRELNLSIAKLANDGGYAPLGVAGSLRQLHQQELQR